jgi:hypothetical protein
MIEETFSGLLLAFLHPDRVPWARGVSVGLVNSDRSTLTVVACSEERELRVEATGVRSELERHEPTVLGQRAGKPDGAVAAERAQLKNALDAANPSEQFEQLALGWGDRAGRKTRCIAGGKRSVKHRVLREQMIAA